jgi:hypothetical protein
MLLAERNAPMIGVRQLSAYNRRRRGWGSSGPIHVPADDRAPTVAVSLRGSGYARGRTATAVGMESFARSSPSSRHAFADA